MTAPADHLILHNARVLTMDADMTDFSGGWIELKGDTIIRLGMGTPPPGPQMDMDGDLIMPGMINAHGHAPMTLFRGLGEEIQGRMTRYFLPFERALVTGETVEVCTTIAALEMIRGGVTTFADMYYFTDRIGRIIDRAGLRAILGQTLTDAKGPDHATLDEGFDRLELLRDLCDGHPLITASAAPHAPHALGLEGMERVAQWSDAFPDLPIQMHLAATQAELDWAKTEGASPVDLTDRAGLLTDRLIAAQVLLASEDDLDLIAESGTRTAHTPRAQGKGGETQPPIQPLRARGVPCGLGSGAAVSSNTLDLISQFSPAIMAQNMAMGRRDALPPVDVVKMATIEGAAALGLQDLIGSLEPGKQADLIRISLKDPRLHPIYEIYATLCYSTLPSDVTASMVAGRWLMQDGQVTTLDADQAMADMMHTARMFKMNMHKADLEI